MLVKEKRLINYNVVLLGYFSFYFMLNEKGFCNLWRFLKFFVKKNDLQFGGYVDGVIFFESYICFFYVFMFILDVMEVFGFIFGDCGVNCFDFYIKQSFYGFFDLRFVVVDCYFKDNCVVFRCYGCFFGDDWFVDYVVVFCFCVYFS